MDTKVKEQVKEYLSHDVFQLAGEWYEMCILREQMRFTDISDLEYSLINFYYVNIPSMIMRDMKDLASRKGYGKAYERGKSYLYHYAGYGCLLPKSEHPAMHTSKAYEVLRDELDDACIKGDNEYRRKSRRKRKAEEKP